MFLPIFLCFTVSSVFGSREARILGGENATQGEFPQVASLQLRERHRCGAVVLDRQWLLTTSHCVDVDTSKLTVVAGSVDLSSGGTRHQVNAVAVHSGYNASDSWVNDIALVRVEPELSVDNTSVAIAELATVGQDTAAGSPAIIVGWGRDAELGKMHYVLQKLNLELIDQQKCFNMYSPLNKIVRDTEICAKVTEAGKGPCHCMGQCKTSIEELQAVLSREFESAFKPEVELMGDSGGPLLVEGVVVGVASWQRGCVQGWPTVYTRVASYVDWIAENKNKVYSRFM